MRYEALLFDLDGVLVDSLAMIERITREWAAGHGLDGDRTVALSHGRRDIDLVRLIAPHLDAEAEAALIIAREERDTVGLRAAPGAAELLTSLPPAAWAVVTSGTRAVATARLDAVGLPRPRILVAAEDVPVGKPDPAGYLRAARLLGRAPERCLVLEDAVAGAAAARAAGMDCLGIGPAFDDHPDLVTTRARALPRTTAATGGDITVALGPAPL